MKHNALELIVLAVLLALAIAILNPAHIWMPDMMHVSMLAGLLVLFGVFAAFVLREGAADEREIIVRMRSGRFGYLAGALVLVAAIALQGSHGIADPWLVLALVAMLAAKLAVQLWSDWRLGGDNNVK